MGAVVVDDLDPVAVAEALGRPGGGELAGEVVRDGVAVGEGRGAGGDRVDLRIKETECSMIPRSNDGSSNNCYRTTVAAVAAVAATRGTINGTIIAGAAKGEAAVAGAAGPLSLTAA